MKSHRAWKHAAVVAGALVVMTACGGTTGDQPDDAVIPATPAANTSPSTPPHKDGGVTSAVRVTNWSVHQGTISVTVRNTQHYTITRAAVDVVVKDFKGGRIALSRNPDDAVCCNIYSLPPGKSYALYVTLASTDAASDVHTVGIRYDHIRFAPPKRVTGTVTVSHPVIVGRGDQRHVDMTLEPKHGAGPYVVGQVVFADPQDKFVAIDSAPYWCLADGNSYRVHSDVSAAIPANAHIAHAYAYSMPPGAAPARIADCPTENP